MKINSLLEKFFSLFKKSKYTKVNQATAKEAMDTLFSRMDILNQKAFNLQENYPELRNQIQTCFENFKLIDPSASVRAGKFEHQIAVAITEVSTACDKIFTSKNSKDLTSKIAALSRAIRERQNADIPQDE